MKNETKKAPLKKRRKLSSIHLTCRIIIPLAIIGMLVLDGTGIYPFNTERIIVLGAGISVMLIPFFNEITIKNISFKKKNKSK